MYKVWATSEIRDTVTILHRIAHDDRRKKLSSPSVCTSIVPQIRLMIERAWPGLSNVCISPAETVSDSVPGATEAFTTSSLTRRGRGLHISHAPGLWFLMIQYHTARILGLCPGLRGLVKVSWLLGGAFNSILPSECSDRLDCRHAQGRSMEGQIFGSVDLDQPAISKPRPRTSNRMGAQSTAIAPIPVGDVRTTSFPLS